MSTRKELQQLVEPVSPRLVWYYLPRKFVLRVPGSAKHEHMQHVSKYQFGQHTIVVFQRVLIICELGQFKIRRIRSLQGL